MDKIVTWKEKRHGIKVSEINSTTQSRKGKSSKEKSKATPNQNQQNPKQIEGEIKIKEKDIPWGNIPERIAPIQLIAERKFKRGIRRKTMKSSSIGRRFSQKEKQAAENQR